MADVADNKIRVPTFKILVGYFRTAKERGAAKTAIEKKKSFGGSSAFINNVPDLSDEFDIRELPSPAANRGNLGTRALKVCKSPPAASGASANGIQTKGR